MCTFKHPKKKYYPLKERALIAWNCLRANQHFWTKEVSNAKPYKKYNQTKLQLSRLTYDKTKIHTHYVSKEFLKLSNGMNLSSSRIKQIAKDKGLSVPQITGDHILGSSNVGECTLDNPRLLEPNGFGEFLQLYLHSLLVTGVTVKENDALALLRGKFLTKDKYNELDIKLVDKDGNDVELPSPPKILTKWEMKKFGLKDSGYKPIYTRPKKLIQFI